jgi:hypothetical protein
MHDVSGEVRPFSLNARSCPSPEAGPWLTIGKLATRLGVTAEEAFRLVAFGPIVAVLRDGELRVDARSIEAAR